MEQITKSLSTVCQNAEKISGTAQIRPIGPIIKCTQSAHRYEVPVMTEERQHAVVATIADNINLQQRLVKYGRPTSIFFITPSNTLDTLTLTVATHLCRPTSICPGTAPPSAEG